jgi:hypothetical protein
MSGLNLNRNLAVGLAIVIIGISGILYFNFLSVRSIKLETAEKIAGRYLESLGDVDLAIGEIMEFEYNHYVVYYEKSSGIGAFEMLIDKESGRIFPEYGPNMMWNLKYGHSGMMGGPRGMMGSYSQVPYDEVINEDEALKIAQIFLDEVYPGSEADDPHPFYGYYTIHTTMDGEIFGMLSVDIYDGAVWYHNWHGEYLGSLEH